MKNMYTPQRWVFLFFCLFSLFSFIGFAQVGIGTTNPDPNALLDLDATTTPGGLLLPRVSLGSTNSAAPLTANVAGMMVYNTASSGLGPNSVSPGYYFNDGSQWVRASTGAASSSDWAMSGNASTSPGTGAGENYLGTSDTKALILATEAIERIRLLDNGQVVVNNTGAPFAGDRFTVQANDTEYAINGYTSNSTAVYGDNAAGAGNGIYGTSTNVGVRGFGAHGALFESGLNGGFGVIAWNTAGGNGVSRTGLLALGQNLNPISFDNTGAILYGTNTGATAIANDATGTGLTGGGNALLGSAILNGGSGLAGTGLDVGIFGYATSTANLPNNGSYGKAGGYFANAPGGYAYVAGWFDPAGGNNTDISYKIIGSGSVSTIVKDVNEAPITMFAPEAPEILFQDYGIGKLINGTVIVQLDPNLTKNIRVDESHPLKVFVQLEGECKGVYVTNKTANSFTVKELQNGRSNVSFSWSIVATRADEVFHNDKGVARVSHNGQRFPLAPKALELSEVKAIKSKTNEASNQILRAEELDSKQKVEASSGALPVSVKETNSSLTTKAEN